MSELYKKDITENFANDLNELLKSKALIGSIKVEFICEIEYCTLNELYPDDTPEQIEKMENDLNNYNAVLFSAEIKITGLGIEASDFLGGCHYKDYNEFLNDSYCEDLFYNAFSEYFERLQAQFSMFLKILNESDFNLKKAV